MNHDYRLDIVVVNYGTDKLLVFFGKGDGTFSQSNSYPTGPNSTHYGVSIADFNEDNSLDIVTANTGSNNVGSSSKPFAVCVGDLNQDTTLDLIVANCCSSNVGVLFGNGSGTFSDPSLYSTGLGSDPYSVAVGDFNNDNQLDITTANYGTNNLCVFLGFGNGSFSNLTSYSTESGSTPTSDAVGDISNDTLYDLIVTHYSIDSIANYHSDNIALFLGFGNGSFRSAILYSTGLDSGPYSVLVGNFNSDDRLDVVSANNAANYLVLFLHYGFESFKTKETDAYTICVIFGTQDETFSISQSYYTGFYSWPYSVAVADFNNDKRLDIAIANTFGLNTGIFLGNGDGTFSAQTTYPTGLNSLPTDIDVSDFNNDHHMDIAVADYGIDNVGVFLGNGNGNGTFLNQKNISTGSLSGSYWVAVGDFNKDGNLDFVAALSLSGSVGVCFGDGNGSFSNIALFGAGTATYPWDIGVVVILWSDQSRIFLVPITYSTGLNSSPQALAVGAFNKDQHLDVVVTYSKNSSVGFFFGYGNESLSNKVTYSTGANSHRWSIAVGYLNNDNILDIVVPNSTTNNIGVLLGLGNGTFKNLTVTIYSRISITSKIVTLTTYPTDTLADPVSIAIIDFNKDNNLDVVANNRANSINIFEGNGDGTFSTRISYLTDYQSSPNWVIAGDFNNDGWVDIIVSASGTKKNLKSLLKLC
ncbi:unnamed protein product [Rotaria socialis]|uniref:Uncharacterized protein n=1 Tax=Rotaria socialis TaxID=392032 RepID=A0A817Z635_9BILA|nr:unnamed protein product [Rotaria socialis]CAF4277771.1 unnamed protein product [Rotaria socialis]CAF4473913.1 unnamed protein product [Rotaria socialis]